MVDSLRTIVGDRSAKALGTLGIETVEDLLRHYPRRYQDPAALTDLASLQVGDRVTVLARVAGVTSRTLRPRGGSGRPRSLTDVLVSDGTGTLTLTYFNMPAGQRRTFTEGRLGLFAGTVDSYRGVRQLVHPRHRFVGAENVEALTERMAERLIPVYPGTEKLDTWQIDDMVELALPLVTDVPETLDRPLRRRAGVIDLHEALRLVHRPRDFADVGRAHARLRWDEAFGVQVILAQRRRAATAWPAVARPGRVGGLRAQFDADLPFPLTAGQREIGDVLDQELAGTHPMHRLLQGDVGSGKTIVALRAMLQVVDSGGQAALLAPTEVLAAQHARTVTGLLGPLAQGGMLGGSADATRVALVTGSLGAAARRSALLEVASGQAGIVIGTHALLEEKVSFADLGMVVVDEQHRFGVEQRAALAAKSGQENRPHTLVMTATPIPRTVAMTVFGDLEVSTLRELPAGRTPLTTHVVPAVERPDFLARAWERAREEVAAGRQVYVVCPRIDVGDAEPDQVVDRAAIPPGGDSDDSAGSEYLWEEGADALAAARPTAAVLTVLPELAEGPLAGLRLGSLTGRQSAPEKDDVMARFSDPARPDGIDVLVATTVVEVGVDVPNATLMIILDADRFGVSQLHQLRGRVGRGQHAGLCLLVTHAPPDSPARERLAAVAATTDGFELSRFDLASRREGDVLGSAQSGTRRSLRLLSVLQHEEVIARAREEAIRLVAEDPDLAEHPALADALARSIDAEHAEFLDKT